MVLDSDRRLAVQASNVTGEKDVVLRAKDGVAIVSGQEVYQTKTSRSKKGIGYKKKQEDTLSRLTQVASDVSAGGSMTIQSGGDAAVVASRVHSDGDMGIHVGRYIDAEGQIHSNNDAGLIVMSAQDLETGLTTVVLLKKMLVQWQ